jgi:cell division septation protein DedD
MQCIAIQANQKRVNGKIRYFSPGEVFDFEECPEHFTPVNKPPIGSDGNVNYATMSEDWLRQYEGDPTELAAFIKETYKDAIVPASATWNELVSFLMVQRDTNVILINNVGKQGDLKTVLTSTPTAITVDVDVPEQPKAPEPPKESKKTKAQEQPTEKPTEQPTQSKPEPDISDDVQEGLDELFGDK